MKSDTMINHYYTIITEKGKSEEECKIKIYALHQPSFDIKKEELPAFIKELEELINKYKL